MMHANNDTNVDSQQNTEAEKQNDIETGRQKREIEQKQTESEAEEQKKAETEQQNSRVKQHNQTESEQQHQTEKIGLKHADKGQHQQEKTLSEQTKTDAKQQKGTGLQERETEIHPPESTETGQETETRKSDQAIVLEHTENCQDKMFDPNYIAVCSKFDTLPGSSKMSQSACITYAREKTVLPSFALLSVPEVKKKKSSDNVRSRLPKALSGKDALKIFQDRENAKKEKELAKQRRIQERLAKKEQMLIEKEQKRIRREENKRKRHQAKLAKVVMQKSRKRKQREFSSSSDSGDDDQEPKLMDSDDEFDESQACTGCRSDEGSPAEWIVCTECKRRWHITCTGDAVLLEVPEDVVHNYPYVCELCM